MKIYTLDWYLKYNLDYVEAAKKLKEQGIGLVLAQSKYLPMADTAVKSEVPPELQERLDSYDDRLFRKALAEEGIEYWAACNMFFDPRVMEKHGNVSVDDLGRTAEVLDWYIGACPTCDGYVEDKIQAIEGAIEELRPDGVFLGFCRFPGFWEIWLPETLREGWREYCFCPRCLAQFQDATGVTTNSWGEQKPGQWIRQNAYEQWVDWKGSVIRDIIKRVKERANRIRPGTRIMLNSLPLDTTHFGQAAREVFGQDWRKLAEVVDVFEVMTYHQILKRPVEWIAGVGSEIKQVTNRTVLCTVQAKSMYLQGMHEGKGRQLSISPDEFGAALRSVKDAGLDGAVVFLWTDFLEQVLVNNDPRRIDMIRALTA
ncbi:MAG: hypothetical protein QME92_07285 [Bacillota bacterium]|nr:hypothetical protein [Bacillota bacterium]